jgi:hypothetical protein
MLTLQIFQRITKTGTELYVCTDTRACSMNARSIENNPQNFIIYIFKSLKTV